MHMFSLYISATFNNFYDFLRFLRFFTILTIFLFKLSQLSQYHDSLHDNFHNNFHDNFHNSHENFHIIFLQLNHFLTILLLSFHINIIISLFRKTYNVTQISFNFLHLEKYSMLFVIYVSNRYFFAVFYKRPML